MKEKKSMLMFYVNSCEKNANEAEKNAQSIHDIKTAHSRATPKVRRWGGKLCDFFFSFLYINIIHL